MTNHVCHPVDVTEPRVDEIRATCGTCGAALVRFIIEDDDRAPRWSGWVVRINRNKPKGVPA